MLPYVFKYKRYKRSHSSVNLFDIVLKLFFERKKSSINVAMNSQCVFRLAGVGSKMKSLPCTNTSSCEMSFNDFRFQLNEELSLLFDHGNRMLRKKKEKGKLISCRRYLRNTICKVMGCYP